MTIQSAERNGKKGWESVHKCPKCGYMVNLDETDLRVIATGMISCPNCDWSGPVRIKIAKPEESGSAG